MSDAKDNGLTPAQLALLADMADGSVLTVAWFGSRPFLTKPNGMSIKFQRRVAAAVVNSELLVKLPYDGRLRDIYQLKPK